MNIAIYILAGISIVLAIGGLAAWRQAKRTELLLSSIVSIAFSSVAVLLPHWWPLIVGFGVNWLIKATGPNRRKLPKAR